MNEHPILFSAPMVRAILEGRKAQTRRVIKPEWWRCLDPDDDADRQKALVQCLYGQVGDHIWVRESFYVQPELWSLDHTPQPIHYAANTVRGQVEDYVLKPSIHMPRWASRITLELTGVRVEGVRDISEQDAIAEGVERATAPDGRTYKLVDERPMWQGYGGALPCVNARHSFQTLWDSLNAARSYSWESNPWVWVLEFRKL